MSRAKIEIVCGEELLLQRTIGIFCSCSCNVAALPDLLPSIIRQVVTWLLRHSSPTSRRH